jgi:hypothetical protein
MSESQKVVSLNGAPFIQPGEPQADVIEQLERVLEMARSGEISGIVIIAIHADECTSSCRRGYSNRRTVGEIEIVKADLIDALRNEG